MSLTVATIETEINTYIDDSGTNTVTAAQRLAAVTEATVWLQEELGNDVQNATYDLNFLDSVNYYKITTAVADVITGGDLRKWTKGDNFVSAAHKSSREIAEEIGQNSSEFSWTIERRDTDTYLAIILESKNRATQIADFDSVTSGGGTWALDTTNGDGTNLTVDVNEFKQGSASLNFDADVSQSGNDKIEIGNTTLNAMDLSDFEDISSWLFWVYIPAVTNFTGFTLYWGDDTSNYWSATVTTDIDGSTWSDGWNRVKIDWSNATKTSSPDSKAIDYIQVDYNYTGSQGDDTDFRLDDLKIVRPEKLTFFYQSWNVGTDTNGADVTQFAATTDIPYFSGTYDQYKYPVAHKASAILLRAMHQNEEAQDEELEALKGLNRSKRLIPSSRTPEVKSFKVMGNRFRKQRGRRSTRRI